MERLVRGLGVRVLAVGLALFLCSSVASAEPITGGDLFGVFARSGTFNQVEATAGEMYTVVWFVDFLPSEFPDQLTAAYYPAHGFNPEEAGFVPDGEFFLIGGLTGEPGAFDHLLLSNRSGVVPSDAVPVGEPLHTSLVNGALSLAGGAAIVDMTAEAFWSLFADPTEDPETNAFTEFFSLQEKFGQGPVVQLSDYNFQGGSEDLFGFDPPEDAGTLGSKGSTIGDYVWYDAQGTESVPIPEPSTLALMFGALALGYGIHRRRRAA